MLVLFFVSLFVCVWVFIVVVCFVQAEFAKHLAEQGAKIRVQAQQTPFA